MHIISDRYQRRISEIAKNLIRSRAKEVTSKQYYNVGGLLIDFGRPVDWDPSADYSDCVDESCSLTDSGYDLVPMWLSWIEEEIEKERDAQEDPEAVARFDNFKFKR